MKFPSIVADVMNNIISVDRSVTVAESAKIMTEKNIGSIIVTEEEKPVGIITKSDMLNRVIVAYKDPAVHKARSIMSSSLISVESDTPILEAMRFIHEKDINQVLVSEGDELVGIVSRGDLVEAVTLSSLTQFSSILGRK
ncbi:CBS domain-containing protein [Candidatus Bathyarchaeota archaeon]|nr:CBS domain-containing protein [Candidatus Bathyarchaeota archaeon]